MKELLLQRLNEDCSAVLTINGVHILFDPWLVNSEIDGSTLFNEAWHVEPVASIAEVNEMDIDLICVSLPFADHCHEETLAVLKCETPILCNQETASILRKKGFDDGKRVITIPQYPSFGECTVEGCSLSFSFLAPNGLLDFTHGGIVIKSQVSRRREEHVMWAPHGIKLGGNHPFRDQLVNSSWALIATTFSAYRLPLVLGGTVNLGLDDGVAFVEQLKPQIVIDIHSERKASRGLVPLVANPEYPSVREKQEALGKCYVACHGLDLVDLLA